MNAYELAEQLETFDDSIFQYHGDKTQAINMKSATMLRQQADRIAELEKDLVLKTRDRDVFTHFTLAYEKHIQELETELDSASIVIKDLMTAITLLKEEVQSSYEKGFVEGRTSLIESTVHKAVE
jgi:2'-5' RNA ligase